MPNGAGSTTTVFVCRGTSCASQHGRALLQDLEELCAGGVACEPRRCMGRCGYGPNVQVVRPRGQEEIVSGLRSYDLVEKCATTCVPGLRISALQRRVAQLKYAARREADAAARQRIIAEAHGGRSRSMSPPQRRCEAPVSVLTWRARRRDFLATAASVKPTMSAETVKFLDTCRRAHFIDRATLVAWGLRNLRNIRNIALLSGSPVACELRNLRNIAPLSGLVGAPLVGWELRNLRNLAPLPALVHP